MTLEAIPVFELPRSQFGALGITLGVPPDAGGGRPAGRDVVIPIVEVNWADERQWCGRVLQFQADGKDVERVPNFRGCRAYRNGACARNGCTTPCAFHELGAEVWNAARRYRLHNGMAVYVDGLSQAEINALLAEVDAGRHD
jgi:hypothetical protein